MTRRHCDGPPVPGCGGTAAMQAHGGLVGSEVTLELGFSCPQPHLVGSYRGGPAPQWPGQQCPQLAPLEPHGWPGLRCDHCRCPSPSRSPSSPKSREASLVPAETTKSPEPRPFPKFLERLPAMSQCSLAAPLTESRRAHRLPGVRAGQGSSVWTALGSTSPVIAGRGAVVPGRVSCSRLGREAARREPSSWSAAGLAPLSWGSAWRDPRPPVTSSLAVLGAQGWADVRVGSAAQSRCHLASLILPALCGVPVGSDRWSRWGKLAGPGSHMWPGVGV